MEYRAEDIEVLSAAEAVRRRLELYVDLADPLLPNRLLQETLCVAIDDAGAGVCQNLQVKISAGGQAEVTDDGPGWPLEPDAAGKTRAEVYMTELFSCRKAKKQAEVGDDICRMGLAVTNALSECCVLTTSQDGWEWRQEYRRGIAVTGFDRLGPAKTGGTRLSFKLDATLLPRTEFVTDDLVAWLREHADALRTEVIDKRTSGRVVIEAR